MSRPRPLALPHCAAQTAGARLRFAGLALALVLAAVPALLPDSAAAAAGMPIRVNDTRDLPDSNLGDGICRAGFGGDVGCTLRAAIQEANNSFGSDTIIIDPGVYELEIPTFADDLDSTGDFDIRGSLTILGSTDPNNPTVVDGGFPVEANPEAVGLDRLFEIHPSAGNVTYKDMTLREGYTDGEGAAIQDWSSGLLRLERLKVTKNKATGAGGGVSLGDPVAYEWPVPNPNAEFLPGGRVEIVDSTFSGNGAGAGGAAINNTSKGTITILRSKVVDNPGQMIFDPAEAPEMVFDPRTGQWVQAVRDPFDKIPAPGVYEPTASAIANMGEFGGVGTIRVLDSEVSRNWAEPDGAGIANHGDGVLVVERSKVKDNTSPATGAGSGFATEGRSGMEATRLTVTENETYDEGGGAYVGSERLVTIEDSEFDKNKAGVPEPEDGFPRGTPPPDLEAVNIPGGGGLYTENGPVEMDNLTFTGNNASDEGGALSIDNHGDVRLEDSHFEGNHAGTDGGAIENSGFRVTFQRLKILRNRAELDGGGIYNSSS